MDLVGRHRRKHLLRRLDIGGLLRCSARGFADIAHEADRILATECLYERLETEIVDLLL
jgi:hypothetical protein